MFVTWWSATCRQRIKSNGFNAIWFILLKGKKTTIRIRTPQSHLWKFNLINWLLTLFAPILLHHTRFDCSFSSFSMLPRPLLGIDCLSFPFQAARARPHPLLPCWPYFPQIPGNSPLPCRAQVGLLITCFESTTTINIYFLHFNYVYFCRSRDL